MLQILSGGFRASSKKSERNYAKAKLIKYVIPNFDEEELKNSPKLFSKVLLACLYLNRSNRKDNLRRNYKRALLEELLKIKEIHPTSKMALFYRLLIEITRGNDDGATEGNSTGN